MIDAKKTLGKVKFSYSQTILRKTNSDLKLKIQQSFKAKI